LRRPVGRNPAGQSSPQSRRAEILRPGSKWSAAPSRLPEPEQTNHDPAPSAARRLIRPTFPAASQYSNESRYLDGKYLEAGLCETRRVACATYIPAMAGKLHTFVLYGALPWQSPRNQAASRWPVLLKALGLSTQGLDAIDPIWDCYESGISSLCGKFIHGSKCDVVIGLTGSITYRRAPYSRRFAGLQIRFLS
jgi:hypothetical protein